MVGLDVSSRSAAKAETWLDQADREIVAVGAGGSERGTQVGIGRGRDIKNHHSPITNHL